MKISKMFLMVVSFVAVFGCAYAQMSNEPAATEQAPVAEAPAAEVAPAPEAMPAAPTPSAEEVTPAVPVAEEAKTDEADLDDFFKDLMVDEEKGNEAAN